MEVIQRQGLACILPFPVLDQIYYSLSRRKLSATIWQSPVVEENEKSSHSALGIDHRYAQIKYMNYIGWWELTFTSWLAPKQMDDVTTIENANKNVVKCATTHLQPLGTGGCSKRAGDVATPLPRLGEDLDCLLRGYKIQCSAMDCLTIK